MKAVVLLSAVILLTGCESDASKLSRLQSEQSLKCLLAQSDARIADSVQASITGDADRQRVMAEAEAITDSLREASNRHDFKEGNRLAARGKAAIARFDSLPKIVFSTVPDTGDTSAENVAYIARLNNSGLDTLNRNRAKSADLCTLATRDYNRFMR